MKLNQVFGDKFPESCMRDWVKVVTYFFHERWGPKKIVLNGRLAGCVTHREYVWSARDKTEVRNMYYIVYLQNV